jgi:tripartite-type tricarboxylate transporter receptor subunit TctC
MFAPSPKRGVPRFEYVSWYGLFPPARTPRHIVLKLNEALVSILSEPELSNWLVSQGAEPTATAPGTWRKKASAGKK